MGDAGSRQVAQGLGDNAGILVTVGGWLVAILVAIFTFIAQWRKGGVEETAMVLGKWKELVEAHEHQIEGLHGQIKTLTEKVVALESAAADLRKTASGLERVAEDRLHRIEHLERELEGAKRNLKQQAESFAEQLKRLGHNGGPIGGTGK